MALTRSRTRINIKGGGKLWIRCLSGTGGGIAAGNTYYDLGYLTSNKFVDVPKMVEEIDETGAYIDTKSGGKMVTWEALLDQTGIDELQLQKLADGQYYELYYVVVLANANFQEFSMPLCKLEPGPDVGFQAATKRQLLFKFTCLAPMAAFTRTPTTFNVIALDPYVIMENASLQMPLTGTTPTMTDQSAMATAIM